MGCRHLLYQAQEQLHSLLRNLPNRGVAALLRVLIFPRGRTYSAPSDLLSRRVVELVLSPTETRDRLCAGIYDEQVANNPLGMLQAALEEAVQIEPLERKMREAQKSGKVDAPEYAAQLQQAEEAGLLSAEETARLAAFDARVMELIAVDDFESHELGTRAQQPAPARKATAPPAREKGCDNRAETSAGASHRQPGARRRWMKARTVGHYDGCVIPRGSAGPMHSGAVIYEVSLDIDADAATQLDRWLERHVEAMLTLPGFVEARIFTAGDESEGVGPPSVRRVVHYTVQSRADLDRYLRDDAERMRADAQERFGTRMIANRRILSDGNRSDHEHSDEGSHCRNCDFALKGQYCSNCGQRARVRMITVWELLRDLFGDVFELDSRLWRSLMPLLFKPGHLTLEYLEGRRVRYMPPFRMYLVISVLFFLLISLFSDSDGIKIVADDDGGPSVTATIGDDGADAEPDSGDDPAAKAASRNTAEDSSPQPATVTDPADAKPTSPPQTPASGRRKRKRRRERPGTTRKKKRTATSTWMS